MKLSKLVKINLISYFNYYKILNAKTFKDKLKEIFKFLFVIIVYGIFGLYIYLFAKLVIDGFITLEIEEVILGEFFALASIFILFATVFRVDSMLFHSKDYDLLGSLPLKKSTIIASKMLNLYFSNLIFTIIIMVPVLIVYLQNVTVSHLFIPLYLLTMLIIPLIPTIVATFIGSLISFITSKLRFKKVFQFILMLSLTLVSIYFSFSNNDISNLELANLSKSFINIFNNFYPLTKVYMDILVNYNWQSLLIFMGIPLIAYILTIGLISKFYTQIIVKFKERITTGHYHLEIKKTNTSFGALLKKEFKRFITSPTYILNSTMGIILLLILSIVINFISLNKLTTFIPIEEINALVSENGALFMGIMLLISCTSSSSISLEGKSFWVIKSIPVSYEEIFRAKVLVNFLILFIPSLLVIFFLNCKFHFSFLTNIVYLAIFLSYSILISILGLIINLHFPLLNWTNEIKVIKQSVATFVTIICAFTLGIVPIVLLSKFNGNLYLLSISGIYFIISIFLSIYLKKVGKKLLLKLDS